VDGVGTAVIVRLAALGCLAALFTWWTPVVAIAQTATLVGTVRDDSTGRAVSGAEVVVMSSEQVAAAGADGRFSIAGIAAGVQRVLVRAVGYRPRAVTLRLHSGDTLRAELTLTAVAVELAPIEVTAARHRPRRIGREAFEERRRLGFGRFLDSTDLARMEVLRLSDALRRLGGIEFVRMGDGRLVATSTRPGYRCLMQIVVDGIILSTGGRLGDGVAAEGLDRLFDIHQVEAIEVYRSAAQTPLEYGGATGACGAILIWSRRAP